MIQKIINPNAAAWQSLCLRPALPQLDVEALVQQIFKEIKQTGDDAVKKYTQIFDDATPQDITVTAGQIAAAALLVPDDLKQAIQLAKSNIEKFHAAQQDVTKVIETTPGVACWRESRPIERVGIYIPGGSAPLFSTVLMLGIPAKIAGCKEIVLCSPPDKDGNINPVILYTAQLVGITTIYAIGGIQAIGALAVGTQSIARVDKIFGPGNQYVTAAKQEALKCGVAIDLPAGPSEVLIIADATCNPAFVAADLLSQAEHGADSQVILLTDDAAVADAVINALAQQTELLPRKETVVKCLQNSRVIVLANIDSCIAFSNLYAPEHLILATDAADGMVEGITSAGSVFLGN
ncbi:MAG: histidinol dehydrogenase, partial [Sphingobacteriales bacterium]